MVERLLRPENLEVSLRYVLKHSTRRGSNIFQLLDTLEKPNHFVASRRRWLESQERDGARQEKGQNEWCGLEYQGARAKDPSCPHRTLQTPLLQQSSSSAREEEGRWVLMEDRRRRRIAFENLGKEMLRYHDNSDDVKVGITELQETLEVPVQIPISIQQVAQLARSENGQKIFEVFWKEEEEEEEEAEEEEEEEEEEVYVASWARWDAQWKGLVDLERRCQDISRKIQLLSKRQEIFLKCDRR